MLTYNGTEIEHININGTAIETGAFNGVTVFEKIQKGTAILRTIKPSISLTVITNEGIDVEVWNAGEKVAVLKSNTETEVLLKDTGQDVIIKGRDIIKLDCYGNQLTSLNVQGLTALEWLYCQSNRLTSLNVHGLTALQQLDCHSNRLTSLNVQGLTALKWLFCNVNQLTADVFKDIFTNLVKTTTGGSAILYTDNSGEQNYKDFTQPPELAAAFNAAKAKGWRFYKNIIDDSSLL